MHEVIGLLPLYRMDGRAEEKGLKDVIAVEPL